MSVSARQQEGEGFRPLSIHGKKGSVSKRQCRLFLVKATILVAALFVASKALPTLPAWAVAVIWVVLSAVSALGIAYSTVIRKTHKQVMYEPGGRLSRFNNGRTLCFVVSLFLAALLVMGLLFEIPTWKTAEWCLVIFSVPLYLLVSVFVKRKVEKEYRLPFRISGYVVATGILVGLLLCLIYCIMLYNQADSSSASALASFLNAEKPYDHSHSVMMSQFGRLATMSDALTNYAIVKAAAGDFLVVVVFRLFLGASTLFAVTSMLGTCSLEQSEIKRVFLPLENLSTHTMTRSKRAIGKNIAWFSILVVMLLGGFCFADNRAGIITENALYVEVEQAIQHQIGNSICQIDGKYYDRQVVYECVAETAKEAEDLRGRAENELKPLIEESFDARLGNVDSYLDWYYGPDPRQQLTTDWSHEATREYEIEQFLARIDDGVDDSAFLDCLHGYSVQAEALREGFFEKMSKGQLKNAEAEAYAADIRTINSLVLERQALKPVSGLLDASAITEFNDKAEGVTDNGFWHFIPVLGDAGDRGNYKEKIEAAIKEKKDEYLAAVSM